MCKVVSYLRTVEMAARRESINLGIRLAVKTLDKVDKLEKKGTFNYFNFLILIFVPSILFYA
jgi:hypothetical protein